MGSKRGKTFIVLAFILAMFVSYPHLSCANDRKLEIASNQDKKWWVLDF